MVTATIEAVGGDEALIAALVGGATLDGAAEAGACSVSTVQRRLRDPDFQTRLVEAKNDSLDRLLGVSIRAAIVATGYLLRVVGDDRVRPETRVRAAVALRDVVNIDKALRT